MFNKFWWWFHRKPSSPMPIYFSILSGGLALGIWLVLFMLLLASHYWWQAGAMGVVVILWCFFCYRLDKAHGYVDALYRAYLAHRESVGEKLGKI